MPLSTIFELYHGGNFFQQYLSYIMEETFGLSVLSVTVLFVYLLQSITLRIYEPITISYIKDL